MLALIDCNNFYASVERIFNPSLEGRPIIILSNNDGCVIARSNESKSLGIAMGIPFFKIKDIVAEHKVAVFSSNFALYGDISSRIFSLIKSSCPVVEIYSIDEAFLDLKGIDDIEVFSLNLYQKIRNGIGVPTSIGIASTKTLTKIANQMAKNLKTPVFVIDDDNLQEVLQNFKVEDVWGIGKKLAPKLKAYGIYTAFNLKNSDPSWMRKVFGVVGERIVRELNSIGCIDISSNMENKKSIQVSKSFSMPITSLDQMKEAVAFYIENLGQKLRAQQSVAQGLYVYMRGCPYRNADNFEFADKLIDLKIPTNSSFELIKYGLNAAEKMFKIGISYKKAGVMAQGLMDESSMKYQTNLFEKSVVIDPSVQKLKKLDRALDELNHRLLKDGLKNAVHYASSGITKPWMVKSQRKSPCYTTSWKDLKVVR